MEILKLTELFENKSKMKEIAKAIKNGKIFVYPTDTLYGLGCNAEKEQSIEKIIRAKGRSESKPFSVIVPSKEWIFENTYITKENREFVDKLLPGPYTIILKVKKGLPKPIVGPEGTVGMRIPNNEFCDFIREQNVLFITTSVNLTEEQPVTRIEDIPEQIKQIVDYAIDSGEIKGPGSRVFDITTNELKVVRF